MAATDSYAEYVPSKLDYGPQVGSTVWRCRRPYLVVLPTWWCPPTLLTSHGPAVLLSHRFAPPGLPVELPTLPSGHSEMCRSPEARSTSSTSSSRPRFLALPLLTSRTSWRCPRPRYRAGCVRAHARTYMPFAHAAMQSGLARFNV